MAETHWNNLGAYLKETQILGSIQNSLYWDQNTGMPKKGASWRSEQLTYIAKVLHERNSSEEFSNLIQSAENELADIERNSDNQLFIKDIWKREIFIYKFWHFHFPFKTFVKNMLH